MEEDKNSKIFNPKRTKKQRKYLRNNMTKAEIILWSKLKGRVCLVTNSVGNMVLEIISSIFIVQN